MVLDQLHLDDLVDRIQLHLNLVDQPQLRFQWLDAGRRIMAHGDLPNDLGHIRAQGLEVSEQCTGHGSLESCASQSIIRQTVWCKRQCLLAKVKLQAAEELPCTALSQIEQHETSLKSRVLVYYCKITDHILIADKQ